MDLRLPEDLIGQQVADARDRVLIEQADLHRGGALAESGPELLRRDREGVGPKYLDRRIQANSAESPRIDQQERPSVSESEGETAEAMITDGTTPFPVISAFDLAAVSVDEHDLAGHAQVNAQHRTSLRPATGAGGIAPHALATAVDSRQSPADDSLADLTRTVRAAFVGIAVVDIDDLALQTQLVDDRASRLHLGQFGHASPPLRRLMHRACLMPLWRKF